MSWGVSVERSQMIAFAAQETNKNWLWESNHTRTCQRVIWYLGYSCLWSSLRLVTGLCRADWKIEFPFYKKFWVFQHLGLSQIRVKSLNISIFHQLGRFWHLCNKINHVKRCWCVSRYYNHIWSLQAGWGCTSWHHSWCAQCKTEPNLKNQQSCDLEGEIKPKKQGN